MTEIWYTHRLMHRTRVTSELHDSYFRLMTSKHAIPKIEWAIELLYNSVKTGRQWVGDQRYLETRCDRESHHPAKGALGTPDGVGDQMSFGDQTSWWEDAGMRTCPREVGPPGPWLSSPGERQRHTAKSGGTGEVNMLQSSFSLQLPLIRTNLTIKWEVYLFKEVFAHHYRCVVIILSAWICIWEYNT